MLRAVVYSLLPLVAASVLACSPNVQRSTGQVIDNAGSVIRHGSENLWLPPEERAQEDEEQKKKARY